MSKVNWVVTKDIIFDRILVVQDELNMIVHTIDLGSPGSCVKPPKVSFSLQGSFRDYEVCESGIFSKQRYPCTMRTWERLSDEIFRD